MKTRHQQQKPSTVPSSEEICDGKIGNVAIHDACTPLAATSIEMNDLT
jgi:hypothetical protein